jgi:hypothetical protein
VEDAAPKASFIPTLHRPITVNTVIPLRLGLANFGIKQNESGGPMDPEKPDWQRLCEAAANEEDPTKLMELISKISRDLRQKEDRLRQQQQPLRPAPSLGD